MGLFLLMMARVLLRRSGRTAIEACVHAVYGEVSALWLLKGTGSAPELLDFGCVGTLLVLVMGGGSLLHWRSDKVLNDALVTDVARLFSKCCRAGERMHINVISRRVKSENVLLRNDDSVCLGDFGEARALGERDGVRLSKAHDAECVQAPKY